MTDYSRSESTRSKKKKRHNRTRTWLTLNTILFFGILIAAAWIWSQQDDSLDPAASPIATSSSEVEQSEPPESSPNGTVPPEESKLSPEESEEPDPEASAPDDTGEGSGEGTGEGTGEGAEEAASDSITLALVGDILPAARVLTLMERNGYDYPYRGAKEYLEAADLTAGNLESSITIRGTPAEDKQYLFRAPKETLPGLKEAGFDFLALANNHTLDYGWEGLSDTMENLDDVDLKHGGAGSNDREAFAPTYIESNGMTVAFISVSRVLPITEWKAEKNSPGLAEAYSPFRSVEAIKEAKENADLVVVMVHWGIEREQRPVAHQTDLGHRFIDAGADLVVGSHPHVLQGFESYKGKWIAYSLGNFVFSTSGSPLTSDTGVLNAVCSKGGDCELSFIPMYALESQPSPMQPEKAKELLELLSTLSYNASVEEDGKIVAKS